MEPPNKASEIEMEIPDDSKPGDSDRGSLPPDDDDDDDDFGELFVQLHPSNGNMLYFSSMSKTDGRNDSDHGEEGKDRQDEGEEEGDGTNTVSWPAGIKLAQFVTSPDAEPFLHDKLSVHGRSREWRGSFRPSRCLSHGGDGGG